MLWGYGWGRVPEALWQVAMSRCYNLLFDLEIPVRLFPLGQQKHIKHINLFAQGCEVQHPSLSKTLSQGPVPMGALNKYCLRNLENRMNGEIVIPE